MIINIGLLKKLCRNFGLSVGIRLFIQISIGKIEKLNVPKIAHPIKLRVNTSDLPTFYQVFLNNEYKINFPFEPKLIIDAGANIGLFTLKMKNNYDDAKIICLEPDVDNFNILLQNVANYNDIYCENCGLWNKDTRLNINDKYDMGKWGMVVNEDINGSIKATSIPSILTKFNIDFIDILKLDIETSEKILFSENYESWLPKIKIIIIELHDWMEIGCAKPFFIAINKCMKNYEYSIVGENTIIFNRDII